MCRKYIRFADLQVQLATQSVGEVSEEFRLENTTDERIGFLCGANDNGKPIILQVRRADILDRTNGDRSLRGNRQLIVHDALHNYVDMSTGLMDSQ
jgi:hypothetical protein